MKEFTKDILTYIFKILIIIGFFAVLLFLLAKGKDANLMIGALITAFVTLVNYDWGSSRGSAKKTEIMSKSVKTTENDN